MVRSQCMRWGGAACCLAAGALFGATLVSLFRLEGMAPGKSSRWASRVESARSEPAPAADHLSEGFYQALAAIEAEPSRTTREDRLMALADRWLAKAPAEAFSAFLGMTESPQQRSALKHLVAEWAKIDASAVFARLRPLDDASLRRDLQSAALLGLQERDAASAVRWLESLQGFSPAHLYSELFRNWTKQDLEGAKDKVAQLQNPKGQRMAVGRVAEALAMRDSEEALAWAESLRQDSARSIAMKSVLAVLASNDGEAAWELLGRLTDETRKREAARTVLERWAQRDPVAALNWAEENGGDALWKTAAQPILLKLAARDPQAAATYLDDLPPGAWRDNLLSTVIGEAARADPEETASWVEQLSGVDRATAISALVEAWATLEPQGAARYAERLGEVEQFWPKVDVIAAGWSRVDPAAAVEWAESLPDSERRQALASAVGTWAESDPATAAGYVGARHDVAFQEEAAQRVVTEWGQWRPADAAAWVQTAFDDPEIRAPSYRALATMWLEAYPQAASAWIDTLPLASDRDAAVTVLLDNLATSDPETASAWADTLFDPALRESWKSRLEGGGEH